MKKATARLIITTVILMILLNGVLMAMLWSNRSSNTQGHRPIAELNSFIIQELDFDEETAAEFKKISARHHENQKEIQCRYREIKKRLTRQMIDQNRNESEVLVDSLVEVVKEKELELYRFFTDVTAITTDEQRLKFVQIFREATGPPEYGRIPMQRKSNRPPLPKH